MANPLIKARQLGADVARLNLLTNGGFEIWQRGNGTFGAGVYTADRWSISLGGSGGASFNGSIARDTANADVASTYCWALPTHTGGSAASPDILEQAVEIPAKGKTLSLSMRVKTSVANACRLALVDADGTTMGRGGYHSGSGQYETLTLTMAFTATGPKIWVRVLFEAAGAFYIDNAMLVVGAVPADYVPLHLADDLLRCLRYYQRWSAPVAGAIHGTGVCTATTRALIAWPLPARMYATPTFTCSAATDFQAFQTGAVNATSLAIYSSTAAQFADRVMLDVGTAGGLTAGGAAALSFANLNAYLALEVNP